MRCLCCNHHIWRSNSVFWMMGPTCRRNHHLKHIYRQVCRKLGRKP